MRYNIDLGFGGSGGPWLAWHPQASRDGARKPAVWTLRDTDGAVVITDVPSRGFALDFELARTGWEQASGRQGVAPERRWNATSARYEPQPGPDWKRCFSVPIALGRDKRGTWEQAGLASRIALDDLLKVIAADPVDHGEQVPLVLTIQRWIDRPDVLDRADDGEDTWPDDVGADAADIVSPALGGSRESVFSSPPPFDPADPGPADDTAFGGVDPWGNGEDAAAPPDGTTASHAARIQQLKAGSQARAASAAASPMKAARLRQRAKPGGRSRIDDDAVPF